MKYAIFVSKKFKYIIFLYSLCSNEIDSFELIKNQRILIENITSQYFLVIIIV